MTQRLVKPASPPGRSCLPAMRGFTLVELAALCAVSVLLCALALPGYRAMLQRATRADAVEALTRLQMAQTQHHAHHGLFANDLTVLKGVPQPLSNQGHYQMGLQSQGAEGYRATAAAVPGGRQASDTDCSTLTLTVNNGFARFGPNARCWNR